MGRHKAQDEGEDVLTVALTNRKRNNGQLLRRQGLRLEFDMVDGDRLRAVRFVAVELAQVPGLAERQPLRQRILVALRPGPLTIDTLADALGVDEKQVYARVGDELRRREPRLVRLSDHRIALAAHEPS